MKFPQEYDDGGNIILDDLNEKEVNDPRILAMFKMSRHNNLSIFIISQDYYELLRRTIKAIGNIYYIFKPNNFRDVQNLYQDKETMDMSLNEFKYLTSTCWEEKYQPLTFDITKDWYQGRYRLGLNSIFFPDNSPFQNIDTYNYNNDYIYYSYTNSCNYTILNSYSLIISKYEYIELYLYLYKKYLQI